MDCKWGPLKDLNIGILKEMHDNSCWVVGSYIFCHEEDTKQSMRADIEKLASLEIPSVMPCILTPYPPTPLFDLFQTQPHRPFRVVGEQIDGSFVLDAEVYLFEARWRRCLADKEALSAFSDKVERKREWTRGLFLSISGFSDIALRAMRVGKAANIVVMSGRKLQGVLSEGIELHALLREKVRKLAERDEFWVEQ